MKPFTISGSCGTKAVILPKKGATVVSLQKNGREFLYCNEENLASSERPRCGIPFLFPIFGRLKEGKYTWEGGEYAMEIHGFGHTRPWQVDARTEDSLTLVLEADADTLAQYPFRFRVTLTFRIEDSALTVCQRYENRDTRPMPYNYGFHPYFLTEKPEDIRVETYADTFLDFAVGPRPFGHGSVTVTVPEGAPETGAVFLGVHGPTALHGKDGSSLTMEFDESFCTHVLWTQAGKAFLCVEPVNGSADGLNTGNYLTLAPGETKEAFVTFRVQIP